MPPLLPGHRDMRRIRNVAIVALGLLGSGCAVASNRSYAVKHDGLIRDGDYPYGFRVHNSGDVNALCREPLFIPFLVYAEYQGPPFSVTLDVLDSENCLEQVDVTRVTLVLENGQEEDVPIPQAFCTFRDKSGVRTASFPVVEGLTRHEPLEVRVEAFVRHADGTQAKVRMSGRLDPEKRQGVTDAVTFTAFGIT